MKVLYIGGTGEISLACLEASVAAGHQCAVFNRGRSSTALPPGAQQIIGDLNDATAYGDLAHHHFDVVCQFKAYALAEAERDIALFSGHCGQYLFISSASAYQKPPTRWLISEEVPLANPYWPYSQAKADMETRLMAAHKAGKLPVTIVRPSHTYRQRFPGTFVSGDINAWRMLHGRPVIVHGDGSSLWALTHATDFARPFVKLLGNPRAIGETFHVTGDQAYPFDTIIRAEAKALGVEINLVHVPTDTLVRCNPEWAGPLLGDKAWSVLFDLRKLKGVAGDYDCRVDLDAGLAGAAPYVRQRVAAMTVDDRLHSLMDQIAQAQAKIKLGN
jgi:nucleoside-diphosphate-sugar epimerase